ncbi:HNH endonuclease signature motif containing protein [Escherichia coli]|uniref:HNH endonuclease signature motif containing protein n=1 Tax=Escherichia coli TaxID=562 RepID=UPI00287AE592|nr:HNH endonuclease signature motif containing protein [Escherichia coli]MDS1650687.1 HNH endonuclease signature motif containing protein [Escherichia coli]
MMESDNELKRKLHYDPATGIFTYKVSPHGRIKAGSVAGYKHKSGYIYIGRYIAHRLAWFFHYGVWPEKDIDHINGIKHDNRIINLREVDDTHNSMNKKHLTTHTSSGFRGVTYHKTERSKPKWRVRITDNDGKRICIGLFYSLDEAIAARILAENFFYGEYAPSNGCEWGETWTR